MATKQLRSRKRTYDIEISPIARTHHLRYEVFHKGVKVGGLIEMPDTSWCDLLYAEYERRLAAVIRVRHGRGYQYY